MGRRRFIPKGEHNEHLVSRVAQQEYLFEVEGMKEVYEDLLQFFSKVYYVKIIGHVIMDNHVHVVLKVEHPEFDMEDVRRRFEIAKSRLINKRDFREEMAEHYYKRYTNLSEFMKEVNWRMALAYNTRTGKKGHFWEGRYKNIVVEDGYALLNVLTYVALNPVRAGMVKDPTHYPHSSIAQLKEAMNKGEYKDAPQIKIFKEMTDKIRAVTYLDWVQYAAMATMIPELRSKGAPIQFTTNGLELDMERIWEELDSRAPVNWSSRVYGSTSFRKEMYKQAGWPYREPRASGEPKPPGPGPPPDS